MIVGVIAGAAALLLVLAVVASIFVNAPQTVQQASTSGDAQSPAEDGTFDDPANDPVEPTAQSDALPASCSDIFSEGMKQTVRGAGLTLNPSWSVEQPSHGLSITESSLRDQLAALPQLKCRWLGPEGGGEVGIETTIAVVTDSQGSTVNSRLASLGYTPLSELGGVRYVWERGPTADSDAYGESHIVVGGLWFATHWLAYGPNGYTADVVHTVLG